uniref:Uncharacterized protein n=1 Tax=Caenorhabditis japonica TaxID=281687 RepID=A0A8R1I3K8_CAEJA
MSYQFMSQDDSKTIWFAGICILFGWMIVILICASPHLFRNYLKKWFKQEDSVTEKIRKAEQRLQETLQLAKTPSNFLVDQASVMSAMVDMEADSGGGAGAMIGRVPETRIRLDFVEEEDEDVSN